MAVETPQSTHAEALRAFWKSLSIQERDDAAKALSTSVAYLRQVLACGGLQGLRWRVILSASLALESLATSSAQTSTTRQQGLGVGVRHST